MSIQFFFKIFAAIYVAACLEIVNSACRTISLNIQRVRRDLLFVFYQKYRHWLVA